MLDAYYRQLNEHAPLRKDLASLRARLALQPPKRDQGRPDRSEEDEDEPEHPWRSQDAWLPAKARAELIAFTQRWRLPLESARDALHAIQLSPSDAQPEIRTYFRSQSGSTPYAFIHADPPEAWVYDPIGPTPAGARRKARAAGNAVYRQMLEQIERAEAEWRAQGRRPLPPRSRSKADLNEGARRLFQRVVLRWEWKQIADDAAQRQRAYDEATVAEGVKRWAQQIGVVLPAE